MWQNLGSHMLLVGIQNSVILFVKQFYCFLKSSTSWPRHTYFLSQTSHPSKIYPQKRKRTSVQGLVQNVHSGLMCDSQKLETTQISISRHLDKEIRVYPSDGVPLSNKRWDHRLRNTDESQSNCAKWKRETKKKKKNTSCMGPFNSRKGKQVYNDRTHISGCLGKWGGGRDGL